jgi:hypothetical protein
MKAILIVVICFSSNCWADPVWHCSRNQDTPAAQVAAKEDSFSIAAVGNASDVISVSIRDLIDIYSGAPVQLSGEKLSACFVLGNEAMTSSALKSLGMQPAAIQSLSRKSTIVQSNLYSVVDERQMLQCIQRHFPAVGYLSQSTETEQVAPCF